MTPRPGWQVVVVLAAVTVVLGLAAPPTAGGELPPAGGGPAPDAGQLPPCPAPGGYPGPAGPSGAEPPGPPSIDDPDACRARPTRIEPASTGALPVPRPGYHHLGVTTVDSWSGVFGRLAVRDPAVPAGSYDFVATRFLAKQRLGPDGVAWLEAGWAETGWSGGGAQRVYTFDSQSRAWAFFDDYPVRDGDRIWVSLHSDTEAGHTRWRAWLWWGQRWRLLSAPELPMPERALLEQYVEVHQDRPGPPVAVPPVAVDRVRVRDAPAGRSERWRPDRVPTVAPLPSADYCLAWENRFDSWSAGDCAATVQG